MTHRAKRMLSFLPLLVLGATLPSCAESGATGTWKGTIETLPSGVQVVHNPATGIWPADGGWTVTENLRLGSVESSGPEMFGEIRGLQLDEKGHIYVLDGRANEVRVFDASGAHVRSFGQKGGGPGEMDDPAAIFFGPDGNLWIVDQRNARFTVFDTAGTYVTSHPRPGGFMVRPYPGGVDREGNVYDIEVQLPEGGPGQGGPRRALTGLARFDTQMQKGATFMWPPFQGETLELRRENMIMMMNVPFAPVQVQRLSPDGEIWIGVNDRYRLNRVSFEGDTLRIIEKEFTPEPVTPADLASALDNPALQNFRNQGGTIDERRIPDVKPAFRGVLFDDGGNLWVRPTGKDDEQDFLFDVFDAEGRYLGQVRTPFPIEPQAPIVFRGDSLLTVSKDELEVEYVVRATIERG